MLEVHRRLEHLERITVRAQPLQMLRKPEQSRLPHERPPDPIHEVNHTDGCRGPFLRVSSSFASSSRVSAHRATVRYV